MKPIPKKAVRKLIKHNRRMLAAEMEHAEKTGVRHYPNKTYFKELRKQKKILDSLPLTDLREILHRLYEVTDELTRPRPLKPAFIDKASKEEAVGMMLSVRYLHEYLDEILANDAGSPANL
ncbi:MAG: hypothetical protein ACOCU5_02120 [Bacillota bacterium]